MFLENKINIKTFNYVSILILIKVFFGLYLENNNPNFFFTPDTSRYVDAAKEI